MAEERQPEAPPEDKFGADLDASIKTNEALLKGLQYEYGQRMLRAQQGGGDPPSPLDLVTLKKLEREIENDKVFAEARKLSRRRSGRTRDPDQV